MKIELIDIMGDDLRVVNSARVSMDKQSEWEDDPDTLGWCHKLSDKDAKLVKYLADHQHWSPFSHCMITLRETVPIFIARQRFKHMIGFSYNEVSRRYVDSDPEFYRPDVWRKRAENVKQGSSDEDLDRNTHELISELYTEALIACENAYDAMLDVGVAPEMARMVLPQSMYTSYYCTGSLAAFARAYKLRSEEHAQKEIQYLAEQWDKIIRPYFPVSWAALVD